MFKEENGQIVFEIPHDSYAGLPDLPDKWKITASQFKIEGMEGLYFSSFEDVINVINRKKEEYSKLNLEILSKKELREAMARAYN